MKQRWLPVGILAGGLFAVNVVGRLLGRLTSDDTAELVVGSIALIGVCLVAAGAVVKWAPSHPMSRVSGDIAVASLLGAVVSLSVGPFISEGEVFGGGFGFYFAELFYYLLTCGIGAFFAALVVIILGKDYKSQGWKRYAEYVEAKPRKVIRK